MSPVVKKLLLACVVAVGSILLEFLTVELNKSELCDEDK